MKNYNILGRNKKGFTLVELLVVISILVILPAIIIPNYIEIKNRFALTRVVNKFAQDVKTAQDKALSSVPYKDAFGVLRQVGGYGIFVDTANLGNKKYLIYGDNSELESPNKQYDILDYIVDTIDFSSDESGIIIKEVRNVYDGKVSVNFHPPNPNTTITELIEGQNNVEVVFAMEFDQNQTKAVLINTSGLIQVK